MDKQWLHYLLEQFRLRALSPVEQQELTEVPVDSLQPLLAQLMQEEKNLPENREENIPALLQKILSVDKPEKETPVRKTPLIRMVWFRYAAAIVVIACIGAYFWNTKDQKKNPDIVSVNPIFLQNDIAPGTRKAILTLSDGSKIILDSASNGQLALQGSSAITKQNDRIIYSDADPGRDADQNDRDAKNAGVSSMREDSERISRHAKNTGVSSPFEKGGAPQGRGISFNTMSTPRGGQYQLSLPDGTRVWLNAASSITYPVAYTGNERKITITGEAYLEVSPDKHKPFRVFVNGSQIEVLGTRFNINAYTDEASVKTTLLEGSVRVTKGTSAKILSPGQQAVVKNIVEVDPVASTDQVMAWKNGFFNFNNTDLPAAMRQFERWYDISVKYEGKVPSFDFRGELPITLTLSQMLRAMGKIGVRFRMEGRTLVVSP